MSISTTLTEASSFTVTNARKIASKVATDLKRVQRFYGDPNDTRIEQYEKELVVLIQHNAIDTVTYGFRKDGKWTPMAIKYVAKNGVLHVDDDPGRIVPGIDVSGAMFASFMTYSNSWDALHSSDRTAIRAALPFSRGDGTEPTLAKGYWAEDLNYSSNGRGLSRSTVRGV